MIANQKSLPNPGLSASSFAAGALSCQTRRSSPRTDHTLGHPSSVTPAKAIPPYLGNNPYSALTAAHGHLTSTQTNATASPHKISALVRTANSSHKYWCTVCRYRPYKHSDDWKKHEKEHEAEYVCLLNGPFEVTANGRRCVLCGAIDQDDSHLSAHNIAPCVEAADRPAYKRRYAMVAHLKEAHHVPSGGIIADKWRCKSSKKSWSCGFCIQLFPSLQARLKHIGTKHFEKGQSISDWDFTKVILGLLLQPEIQEAWQHLDPYRPPETKWNKLGNEDLQSRLEMGLTDKETPQSLARAAYDSAEYDWSPTSKNATASAITINTVPSQYINKNLLSPFQDHAVASGEPPLEYQSCSSPPIEASQIAGTPPTSETQVTHGISGSSSSPANNLPELDHGPIWTSLGSDTGKVNSTQPTTPSNDIFNPTNPLIYSDWDGYNYTPNPVHSDQEISPYKSNDLVDYSARPQSNTDDVRTFSSTLKRPRYSVSPTTRARPRQDSLDHRPRKKTYRKSPEETKKAPQSLGIDDEQREKYDNKNTRSIMDAKWDPDDGLYT